MPQLDPKSLYLLRHQLGSIDLEDISHEDITDEESESEHREYCSAISAVFPRLERDIKKFMWEQLKFASLNSENWDQVTFARGTFNGFALLLDHWKKAHVEHSERGRKESFDKNSVVPEI